MFSPILECCYIGDDLKLIDTKPLDEYLAIADSVQAEVAITHPEWMGVLRELDELWQAELFGDTLPLTPISSSLCLQSFYYWLASVRVALSGHASAVYPLLRTSLEAACYAYKIAHEPTLSKVWLSRDESPENRKLFRSKFGQAVADTAKRFEHAQDLGSNIREMYDAAIDFGGHPNPRAILDHLHFDHAESDKQTVSLSALNSAQSINTVRSMVALAEHGYFSIAICANAAGEHPRAETLQARMDAVIKRVQRLTLPYTSAAPHQHSKE